MQSEVVEEIIYGLESGILFGYVLTWTSQLLITFLFNFYFIMS